MTHRSSVSLPEFEGSIDTSAGATQAVSANGGSLAVSAQGGSLGVTVTNISGDVKVTAPNPLSVSAQGGSFAVSANGGFLPTVASVSGDVRVTSAGLPLNVTAAGGSFAVSAQGGFLPVVATISGDVRVTAGNTPLPVLASISGDVKVTAPNPLAVSANTGAITVSANTGTMNVSAANGALPVAQRSDYLWSGPLKASAQFASIDVNAAACADVIAGTSGRKIRVLSGFIISAGTVQATFITTGAFTKLTGGMNLGRGFTMNYNPMGHFETARGSALSMQLGASVSAGGALTYVKVSG